MPSISCRQTEPQPANENDSQVLNEADASSTARGQVLSRHNHHHLRPSHSAGEKHYRGVRHWYTGKFTAEILVTAAKIWVGSFDTAEEAALAYDRAALRWHGPNAILNFPAEIAAAAQRLDRNAKDNSDSSKNYLSNSSTVSSDISAEDSKPETVIETGPGLTNTGSDMDTLP